MNFEFEEEETDRILAAADNTILESQPGPSPEILSAATSPTRDAAEGTEGMAPREGSRGERAFARGPLLVFRRASGCLLCTWVLTAETG